MIESEFCRPNAAGGARSSQSGPITYFIYKENYGVTAFGTAGEWPKSKSELEEVGLRVASQFVLQSQAGLLRAAPATNPFPVH
jgi:hypothetical protein